MLTLLAGIFSSRLLLGLIGGIGGLAVVAVGAYLKGNSDCSARAELANARAEIVSLEEQVRAQKEVISTVDELYMQHIKDRDNHAARVEELEGILAKRENLNDCPIAITPNELRGLENIR